MKTRFLFSIFALALTACPCPPMHPFQPHLDCFQIFIEDNAGVDLIKKNLAEFEPEIKTGPFVWLPSKLYNARIILSWKDFGPITLPATLRMYYTNDTRPYSLWYEHYLQKYYEQAGSPETGTIIYTLTFPLLFGDDRTLQIEADWRMVPVESKRGGHYLWYDKITVNGEPIPVPDLLDARLFLTL